MTLKNGIPGENNEQKEENFDLADNFKGLVGGAQQAQDQQMRQAQKQTNALESIAYSLKSLPTIAEHLGDIAAFLDELEIPSMEDLKGMGGLMDIAKDFLGSDNDDNTESEGPHVDIRSHNSDESEVIQENEDNAPQEKVEEN